MTPLLATNRSGVVPDTPHSFAISDLLQMRSEESQKVLVRRRAYT
jgi:hypothetical protein